jgi:hypothetical protein
MRYRFFKGNELSVVTRQQRAEALAALEFCQ